MAQPLVTTVTIDGNKFDALSASVGVTTQTDAVGLPMMGTFQPRIELIVDIHDDKNMPYATLQKLFQLAKTVTRDKIKDVKIEFWKDENRQDVVCSYVMKGWISHFQTNSAGGENHTLKLSIQPALDPQNVFTVDMSN
jgi:hypothetical protein